MENKGIKRSCCTSFLLSVGCLQQDVEGGPEVLFSEVSSVSTDSLSFYLLGDWGKGGTTGKYGSRRLSIDKDTLGGEQTLYQVAIASSMAKLAENDTTAPSFVVALGDNFYNDGVSSSTDTMWNYLWKDVYLRSYPKIYVPWYPVFGNHDYGGSISAQIQRTADHTDDDIWSFEAQYYMKQFAIPGPAGGFVAIVFIDTTTLAPSQTKYTNENGGISSTVQAERIAEQLTFINESLASVSGANRSTWLFVAGHYPVYSSGDHGDMSELITYLLPLLQYYEVDAYFCGHDHISEHLQYGGAGTHHFVAGAGSMVDYLKNPSVADLLWYGVGYSAFAQVTATMEDFTVQYVDIYGQQRYSFMVPNLRPWPVIVGPPTSGDTPVENTPTVEIEDSFLDSLRAWYHTAAQHHVFVMSGSVLTVSVLLFLCYVGFKRRDKTKKLSKIDDNLLTRARQSNKTVRYLEMLKPKPRTRSTAPTEFTRFSDSEDEDDHDHNNDHNNDSTGGDQDRETELGDVETGCVSSAETSNQKSLPAYHAIPESTTTNTGVAEPSPRKSANKPSKTSKSLRVKLLTKLRDMFDARITAEDIRQSTLDGRVAQQQG